MLSMPLLFHLFTVTFQAENKEKRKKINLSSKKINSALHSGQVSGGVARILGSVLRGVSAN